MTSDDIDPTGRMNRAGVALAATAALLAALDLGLKMWASRALALADADGVVTDYLHTGWFPTFNLADVFITVGAAALVLGGVRKTTDSATASDEWL